MKAGELIIEAARKAQAERKGIRVKVRVPSPLWSDVKRCANACAWSTEEWVCSICRMYISGMLGVPSADYSGMGTREESETVWVRVPAGFNTGAENMRKALSAGVEWYIPKITQTPPPMIEGRDYFVKGRDYSGSIGFFRKAAK